MKKKKTVKLGDVKIEEVGLGYLRLFLSSIMIDGVNHVKLTDDILDGFKFIISTKKECCKGRLTEEMLRTRPGRFKLAMGERTDGYYEFIGYAMKRKFILAVKDREACINLLNVIGSKHPKSPVGDFIAAAARKALEFMRE